MSSAKADKIANAKNQFCKIIPSSSTSKSLSEEKAEQSKLFLSSKRSEKIKKHTKSTKSVKVSKVLKEKTTPIKTPSKKCLSFKDLNNHFSQNLFNQIGDCDLEDKFTNIQNLNELSLKSHFIIGPKMEQESSAKKSRQHDDSSDESSICSSADLSLQSSSTSSSSSSICQQECAYNLTQCHSAEIKTCVKKSFVEQRFRVELEHNKLNTMMSNPNGLVNGQTDQMNNQIYCQANGQMNQINDSLNSQMNQQLPNYHSPLPQVTNYQANYENQDFSQTSNYMNHSNLPNYLPNNMNFSNNSPNHFQMNTSNTVSFNNLVSLANQFKMSNRVSAAESKVNKLFMNSLNERRKLTVQNNLVRQTSFTYSPCNSPLHSNAVHSNHNTVNNNQQQNSLERNNLGNLKAFLNRNKHLTNAYDDSYSDSECSNTNKFDYLSSKRCALSNKCSNSELLNKNLNRPMSISQQNTPSHINYREKLCCQSKSNWSKFNEQHCDKQYQSTQLNQSHINQQLKLIAMTPVQRCKEASSEILNNEEILQVNKGIDCLKSNLYWNDKKDHNYLNSSQTMPSPSKLKQQQSSDNSFSNITSLTNLNSVVNLGDSSNLNSVHNSADSAAHSSSTLNSTNTLNSTSNNSSNTVEANYSLTLPFVDQLKKTSPKLCSSKCSLSELKKLRKDLHQSNLKVNLLTEQLNTNAQMVSAFERNLHTMTNRIAQKETELNQLKLLASRLLNVKDLKKNEIEHLLEDMNSTTRECLMAKNSNQLVRRHTFSADELEFKLNKSLQNCDKFDQTKASKNSVNKKNSDKNVQYSSNSQISDGKILDGDTKACSSWSKLTKAFKKTSLSKYSPMHKAINNENKSIVRLDEESSFANLSLNSTLDSYNPDTSCMSDEKVVHQNDVHQNLRRELDEKEKQLCDLRLETLGNQNEMDNLRIELIAIKSENERLNRLIKEKSSLMSSKASLFSMASSVAENARTSSTCNVSIGNASSNIAIVNTHTTDNTTTQSSYGLVHNHALSTHTSTTSSLANKSANQIKVDHLISPPYSNSISSNDLDEQHSTDQQQILNLEAFKQRQALSELNSSNSARDQITQLKDCKRDDNSLLKEGKLVSVELNLWNECIAKQQLSNLDRKMSNQTSTSRSKLDAITSSNDVGLLRISTKTSWQELNRNLKILASDYLSNLDPNQTLGLSSDSIYSYEIDDSKEIFYLEQCLEDELVANRQPFDHLTNDSKSIIKLKCKSMLEQFVLQTLIPKSVLLRLIGLLFDNKRCIISGPVGIGKTYIAHKLAEYLIQKLYSGDCLSASSSLLSSDSSKLNEETSSKEIKALIMNPTRLESNKAVGSIATYYIDAQNCHNLYHYLNSIVQQCDQQTDQIDYRNVPTILIIDNLHFIKNIDETFSPLMQLVNKNCMPYVIATFNHCSNRTQTMHSSSLLNSNIQLSNHFKWAVFNNHLIEPICGLLLHFLRKKAIKNLIEQKYNYLSEFNLLEIDEKHLTRKYFGDENSPGLASVLADLETKRLLSFRIIDWLHQVLRHLNEFIQVHSYSSSLGPCIFIECPIDDLDKTKDWFNRNWNDLIIPYLNEIVRKSQARQNSAQDLSQWVMKASSEIDNDFNLKNLNDFRLHNEKANTNLDPLLNALHNLNKLTNQ